MIKVKLDRFKGVEERDFEIEIVTPLFLGGANPKKAELRPSSIKGILRFWWRALHSNNNIQRLLERESRIFGSADENSGGKSRVYIKVKGDVNPVLENLPLGKKFTVTTKGKTFPLGIIHYLSYGLYEYRRGEGNVFIKEFFKPGDNFKIILGFHGLNNNEKEEVLKAFSSMINFGGLGARSRNGFGSLSCSDIDIVEIKTNNPLAEFTSFSRESLLFVFNKHNRWEDALSEIGMAYRTARLSLERRHNFFRRGYIARPIEVRGERIPNFIRKGRHAKPYFLHVSKINRQYQGQILYMPYRFYENNNHQEFIDACESLNRKLEEAAREVKYEF